MIKKMVVSLVGCISVLSLSNGMVCAKDKGSYMTQRKDKDYMPHMGHSSQMMRGEHMRGMYNR